MRWCSTCGRPKELHSKVGDSKRLPKTPAPRIRECVLYQVYDPDLTVPTFRADSKTYAGRMMAHRDLQAMRFI